MACWLTRNFSWISVIDSSESSVDAAGLAGVLGFITFGGETIFRVGELITGRGDDASWAIFWLLPAEHVACGVVLTFDLRTADSCCVTSGSTKTNKQLWKQHQNFKTTTRTAPSETKTRTNSSTIDTVTHNNKNSADRRDGWPHRSLFATFHGVLLQACKGQNFPLPFAPSCGGLQNTFILAATGPTSTSVPSGISIRSAVSPGIIVTDAQTDTRPHHDRSWPYTLRV